MTKAIDDIKKIRDALNEIFEPRSTIASNSSPKPVNEPRSSSISGSSSSKEDMAMNNLNLYAKKLQNDPDNLNLEDAIQTVIWSMRSGKYGDFRKWENYIEHLRQNPTDMKTLMAFINDYKQSK